MGRFMQNNPGLSAALQGFGGQLSSTAGTQGWAGLGDAMGAGMGAYSYVSQQQREKEKEEARRLALLKALPEEEWSYWKNLPTDAIESQAVRYASSVGERNKSEKEAREAAQRKAELLAMLPEKDRPLASFLPDKDIVSRIVAAGEAAKAEEQKRAFLAALPEDERKQFSELPASMVEDHLKDHLGHQEGKFRDFKDGTTRWVMPDGTSKIVASSPKKESKSDGPKPLSEQQVIENARKMAERRYSEIVKRMDLTYSNVAEEDKAEAAKAKAQHMDGLWDRVYGESLEEQRMMATGKNYSVGDRVVIQEPPPPPPNRGPAPRPQASPTGFRPGGAATRPLGEALVPEVPTEQPLVRGVQSTLPGKAPMTELVLVEKMMQDFPGQVTPEEGYAAINEVIQELLTAGRVSTREEALQLISQMSRAAGG